MSDTTEATYCPIYWGELRATLVAREAEIARLRDVLADLLIECELTAVKHPQQIATRKRARAELERGT